MAVRLSWTLLVVGFLFLSGLYSARGPLGVWKNTIFGSPAWNEADPGSWYVMAAHELTPNEQPLFVGHPGSTLLIILAGIQHGVYAISSPDGLSYTQFTARSLPKVFLASKLTMTLLHLASFWAMFHFSRRILRDRWAAHLAPLAYATSLPVLYFLSRISAEPLMVLFCLTSFLAIWRYQELVVTDRPAAALVPVALSAALAVSGALSKFNFLAPLPVFMLAYLLYGTREATDAHIPLRDRAKAIVVFLAAGSAVWQFYGLIFDVGAFWSFWRSFLAAPGAQLSWTLLGWLPGISATRIFPLAESLFILIGVAGWLMFLRSHRGLRERALWATAYACFTGLLWGYRVLHQGNFLPFHYFFLPAAMLSVFAGYFVTQAVSRLPETWHCGQRAALAVFGVCLMHAISIWTVLDSRQFDAAAYAKNREYVELISQLKPGEKVGMSRRQPKMQRAHHSIPFPIPQLGRVSRLRQELDDMFVFVGPAKMDPDSDTLVVPGLVGRVAVFTPDP